MQNEFFASNSCRTCRQKRVKCDRGLPACVRCSSLKLRCQGYERPRKLTWTNSVASRGKMMGKTTFTASDALEQPNKSPLSDASWHTPCAEEGQPAVSHAETCHRHVPVPVPVPVLRSLVDTDLQDLGPACRMYIRYFDLELSRESVVYNQPSTNPFLALMPLLPSSQALSHAIISISAFHHTHRMVISHAQLTGSPSDGNASNKTKSREQRHSSQDYAWQLFQPSHRESLHTAISHKQKALECLKHEIRDDPLSNSDAVVAAIVLFICMDVVEFGSHGWNHHLKGAEEMVRSRRLLMNSRDSASAPWLEYFDTACTTFGILGATLAPTSAPSTLTSPLSDPSLLQIIRHSENQTWVGCPAELLYLLSTINSLRMIPQDAPGRAQTILKLWNELHNFSPSAWAQDFSDQQHHESRSHLAHAYKAAVEVYASHIAGSSSRPHYMSRDFTVEPTQPAISHLLSIPTEDLHIKSLVWPAFVVGAETRDPGLRDMVRTVFHRIWLSSCCYNVKNAMEVLETIWEQDQDQDLGKTTWLDYVWQLEDRWLFV